MTSAITRRVHRLADSLRELKLKVRAALATELAGAVGTAVRDVLVVALVDRLVATAPRTPTSPREVGWRDDGYDRDRWDEPRDPWADDYDPRDRLPARDGHDDREESGQMPAVPVAAAVAVGANVGRWWLSRRGSIAAALGVGVLAAGLGLAGGPVARAALAVLAAATDLLSAESALARIDPS
jgi:hypothetical protein